MILNKLTEVNKDVSYNAGGLCWTGVMLNPPPGGGEMGLSGELSPKNAGGGVEGDVLHPKGSSG